jgi:enoyl-CoA hydratase
MSTEAVDSGKLAGYYRQGAVGFIALNRPEKRNALNVGTWKAIGTAVDAAHKDVDARVIVVTGNGKSFCAGLDLGPDNEIMSLLSGPVTATQKMEFYRTVREIQDIYTRLERLPQPTIAAIHGHCLGAGLELVLCCDMRVCSEDVVFALPEATLAIITDVGGLQRLPRVVGQSHAREIAFRGHRFGAEHAHAINLVNHVYPDHETLMAKTAEIADEIAGNPPLAVQGAKDVFLFEQKAAVDRSLDYNAARSSMVMPSEDLFEAVAAFMQKRKGIFKGA